MTSSGACCDSADGSCRTRCGGAAPWTTPESRFASRASAHPPSVRLGRETLGAFPDAARIAGARLRELRALKYSTRKAEYIRGLAHAVVSGTLDLEAVCAAPTPTVIERLTALRGLGRWTADWFLARCLGRGDVCPAGDLAVRKAFDHYYGRGKTLSEKAIRRRAGAWGQYQNLAVHYLLAGMRLKQPAIGGGT